MELKKKLLETRNITLAHVLERKRASEVAGPQVKHMAGVSDKNAVRRKEVMKTRKRASVAERQDISHVIRAV